MKRFLTGIRTDNSRRVSGQNSDAFTRELAQQAEKLLASLSQQFLKDLTSQTDQILKGLNAAGFSAGTGDLRSNQSDFPESLVGGFGRLANAGIGYLLSRPHSTATTQESSRSQQVDAQFRLSQNQILAEAQNRISKGNKNL